MVTLMEKQLAWKYQDFVLAALWLDSASADPLLGLLSQKSIYKFKFLGGYIFYWFISGWHISRHDSWLIRCWA